MKLFDFPVKTDCANENAFFACLLALRIHVAALEFFFERDVRFLGTAILNIYKLL